MTATAPSTAGELPSRRHPVRGDGDGDFALGEILALGRTCSGRPPEHSPVDDDATALHRFETCGLFEPPVADHLADLTPEIATRWLAIAAHWIELSLTGGDLRYLNTACKLLGAVWVQHRKDTEFGSVTSGLADVGHTLDAATTRLRTRLARRVVLTEPMPPITAAAPRITGREAARIAVLAGAGSRSAARLVTAATSMGLPITGVCRYTPARSRLTVPSNYSAAWYPPSLPDHAPAAITERVRVTEATSWDAVADALAGTDLVLLTGMPIVPPQVLQMARLGVLNAHNGILPTVRGMDAVGWALLHNQPIVCTLHLGRPKVDTGEVIATHPVPTAPTTTLAGRVKATQLRLLLAGAAHVATTGALPDATPQPAGGTQYYRLHPHLKRVLDTSPYGHDTEATVIRP
jgi:hypothetical protein